MQTFLNWMSDWKKYVQWVWVHRFFSFYVPVKKHVDVDGEEDFVDTHDLLIEEPVNAISYPMSLETNVVIEG